MYPQDTQASNPTPTAQSRSAGNPTPQPDEIEMPPDYDPMELGIPEDILDLQNVPEEVTAD